MASDLIGTCISSLDSEMLEEVILQYVNEAYRPPLPAQRVGVSGQSQNGVDIYSYAPDHGHHGFQSKAYRRSKKLDAKAIDKEVESCHSFEPKLDFYTFVTLNRRDAKLQAHVSSLLLHGKPHRVSIIALEDLASIVSASQSLKRAVFSYAFKVGDVEAITDSLFSLGGTTTSSISQDIDQAIPQWLRTADDWVNGGMPLRALNALEAGHDAKWDSQVARIRCRALYSLGRYQEVLSIAEEESNKDSPNSSILILGALSASEINEVDKADRYSKAALEFANDGNRSDAVGGYIRLAAKRDDAAITELEDLANRLVGNANKVAIALADAALIVGDGRRALHWFRISKSARPNLPVGSQINEIAAELAVAIEEADSVRLLRLIANIEQRLDGSTDVELTGYRRVLLTNLGAACRAAGRYVDAASAWDEALSLDGEQSDIWIHRCMLGEYDRAVRAPSPQLAEVHASSVMARLAFISAMTSEGNAKDAKTALELLLDEGGLSALERSIAHVERLRLARETLTHDELIADAIRCISTVEESLPLLGWIAAQYLKASSEARTKIEMVIREIDPNKISDEAVLSICSSIALRGHGRVFFDWIARVKSIALDGQGRIKSEHAARALCELQQDTLDFEGCILTLKALVNSDKGDALLHRRLAQAHYFSGDREQALNHLEVAVSMPGAKPETFRDWAVLATSLGRRRTANRKFQKMEKPKCVRPSDFVTMMQTRAILGVRESDQDAIEILQSGLITPERASQVFALGLRRKAARSTAVASYDSIVSLKIGGELEGTYFLSAKAGVQIPGIRTLDPVNHPWISQLIGLAAGAEAPLSGEPFDGKRAEIASVVGPADYLFAESLRQINLSSTERTGVRRIEGDIEAQLRETKKILVARDEEVSERVTVAKEGRFPISLIAKQFNSSPRDLLQANRTWVPNAHSGTANEIEADEAALARSKGWIFDATTILLLATIGAERFPGRLATLARVTKTTVAQLQDWRSLEREHRRGVGHFALADDGRICLLESSASSRVAHLVFWGKVDEILRQCRVIDVPTVGMTMEEAKIADVFELSVICDFHAARFHGFTLVSEESNVREFARFVSNVATVPLHALIVEASRRNWITDAQAMQWVARLIQLGWTWVWFPSNWFAAALNLPEDMRWQVLEALSSRIRLADPITAIKTVVSALVMVDRQFGEIPWATRYRALAFESLPELEPRARRRLLLAFQHVSSGTIGYPQTLKMFRIWANAK